MKIVTISLFFLIIVGITTVAIAEQNAIGRYQLVSEQQGTVFLLDTMTGRVWRYSELTGDKSNNPCLGTKACFLEVDREQLTATRVGSVAKIGWRSEVFSFPLPEEK